MFGEGAGNSRGMIPRCMEEVFAQLERKAKVRNAIWRVRYRLALPGNADGRLGCLHAGRVRTSGFREKVG